MYLTPIRGPSQQAPLQQSFLLILGAQVPVDDSSLAGANSIFNQPQVEILVEMKQPGSLLYEPVESLTSPGMKPDCIS